MIQRSCEAGIAIAAGHDFRGWPGLTTDLLKGLAVLSGRASGEENSHPINLLWQLGKNTAQTLGRSEPEIRRRKFAVLDNAKFRTAISRARQGLNQRPGSFSTPAFN